MEKTQKVPASVVLKKTEGEKEKIVFRLNTKSLLQLAGCFIFGSGTVFSGMTPFGISFYASVFKKESWVLGYVISLISIILFATRSKIVYIAALTLTTALLAVIDIKNTKWQTPLFSSVSYLAVKLVHSFVANANIYTCFEAFVECGLIFVSCFVFEQSFNFVISASERSFISAKEKVCTMALFAIFSLSLADFEPIYGFNVANVFSVLMIYIFSLGGINGGAVMLGVLLGAVGSLKAGSFSDITSTFAFGALLGSVLSLYGRVAIVLGFITANSMAAFILSDSVNVAIGIYDSIAAAIIFFLLPGKVCNHISFIFCKSASAMSDNCSVYLRASAVTEKRLKKISRNLSELERLYSTGKGKRSLGKDYIMTKFNEVVSSACMGCSKKTRCFKNSDSPGYRSMTKMLDTAFKHGKITPLTLPEEFKNQCQRSNRFAEKFNNIFAVIKTERQWVAKLDECRSLVADQLGALAESFENETKRCNVKIDLPTEEALWAESDKAGISPVKIVAEKYPGGDFCISIYMASPVGSADAINKLQEIVSKVTGCKLICFEPEAEANNYIYSFSPAKKISLTTGSASRCKNNEKVSGDNFAIINGEGGFVNIVLSDGMGSGCGAAKESSLVVEMMKKFLKAGVKSSTAVKLVNSSLLLQSMRDSFSTVDMCTINLSDATCEITKLGAAKSYIKRKDEIFCIKPGSLPLGILREAEAESKIFTLDSDTVIVLMSDGIADIELKYPQYEGWIEAELLKMNTSNSQLVATKLVEKASKLLENKIYDDMTVVAVCIQKV